MAEQELKEDIIYYFEEFKRKASPAYKVTDAFDKYFEAAANLCEELGASAFDFVQAAFHNTPSRQVKPEDLMKTSQVRNYRELVKTFGIDYEDQYRVYERRIKSLQQNLQESERNLLLLKSTRVPNWFRHLKLRDQGIDLYILDFQLETAKPEFREFLNNFGNCK